MSRLKTKLNQKQGKEAMKNQKESIDPLSPATRQTMDRKNIKKALSLIREGDIDKAEEISKTLNITEEEFDTALCLNRMQNIVSFNPRR